MIEITDPREQDYITMLTSRTATTLRLDSFIYECVIPDCEIAVDKELRRVIIPSVSQKESEAITTKLVQLISLIEYLRSEQLIFLHHTTYSDERSSDETIKAEENSKLFNRLSPGAYDYLVEYADSYVFVRSELYRLVERNFKTREQTEAEKQYRNMEDQLHESRLQSLYARRTVRWSITAVVISIAAPLIVKLIERLIA